MERLGEGWEAADRLAMGPEGWGLGEESWFYTWEGVLLHSGLRPGQVGMCPAWG